MPARLYFGRQVAVSDRTVISRYALPKRAYLGPTSMDTEMAFLICNQAQVLRTAPGMSCLVLTRMLAADNLNDVWLARLICCGSDEMLISRSGSIGIWTSFCMPPWLACIERMSCRVLQHRVEACISSGGNADME